MVLLYENRTDDPILLDVETEEKMTAAILWLFNYLRYSWDVYSDLENAIAETPIKSEMAELQEAIARAPSKTVAAALTKALTELQISNAHAGSPKFGRQIELYRLAQENDVVATAELLRMRKNYEFEHWNLIRLTVPELSAVQAAPVASAGPTTNCDELLPAVPADNEISIARAGHKGILQ